MLKDMVIPESEWWVCSLHYLNLVIHKGKKKIPCRLQHEVICLTYLAYLLLGILSF